MFKKSVAFFAGLLTVCPLMATPLNPAEALARLSKNGPKNIASKQFVASPVLTIKCKNSNPAVYVFAENGGAGYSIISADDVAYPLLGYSDKDSFDPTCMPPAMSWWLGEYARQIEWASSMMSTSIKEVSSPSDWVVIEPLCATTWNQDAPFNNDCPVPSGSSTHCYTGCVATSMAQAMKYFNYPEQGHGTIQYRPSKLGQTISMTLDGQKFDWDNMLASYRYGKYNEVQASAVALLMKACGFSVNMNYGTDASGASGSSIGTSLRNYFDYDANCHSEYRLYYSMNDWMTKIYNNLKNIGPVIINGHDLDESVGHSFICDGYDGKGYFHFNWGWGGMSDGYFSLDALNPDAMGIGGYGGGFNYSQNAIFGIQPNRNQPSTVIPNITMFGNANPTLSGTTLSISTSDNSSEGFWNYSDDTVSGVFGLKYQSVSNPESTAVVTSATLGTFTSINLTSMTGYSSSRIKGTIPSLQNGDYKVTIMFKANGRQDWEEILVPWGYNNFFFLTKSGSSYTVKKADYFRFSIDKAEVLSEPYYEYQLKLKLTLTNPSDKELTQGVCARLMNGNTVALKGGNYLISVPAGETVEQDFITSFSDVSGTKFSSPTTYALNFVDPETGKTYGNFGNVTLTTGPKTSALSLSKLEVQNSTQENYDYNGTKVLAYPVDNMSDFDVQFDYKVRYGYFTGLVKLSVYKTEAGNVNTQIPIPALDEIYSDHVFMAANQSSSNIINVSVPEPENGVVYQLVATYILTSSWNNLGTPTYFYKSEGSGIADLVNDNNDSDVEYYNLQGIKIENPQPGQMYIKKNSGKSEKIIY